MTMTLGEIAVRYGLELAGEPGLAVEGVAALTAPARLSRLIPDRLRELLGRPTQATPARGR